MSIFRTLAWTASSGAAVRQVVCRVVGYPGVGNGGGGGNGNGVQVQVMG